MCICVSGGDYGTRNKMASLCVSPSQASQRTTNRIVKAFVVNAQELTFGASDRYGDILHVRWRACEETADSRVGGQVVLPARRSEE